MNVLRFRALIPVATALVMGTASVASAQAPTVSASVNGAVATVQWTPVPGATGYDVIVTGSLVGTVNVPASVTSFTVTPPPGTYGIQIRGTAAGIQGPISNQVTITIGGSPGPGPGCQSPAAPSVTVSVNGFVVTVAWNAVSGAQGYRVEFSRTPGGTELVQTVGASQTSLQGTVPLVGTFYVRVVSGNACGTSTSEEKSFAVGAPPAPGPGPGGEKRAPDPVPGQPGLIVHAGESLLPIPAYAADVVNSLARQFPGEAALARPTECRGGNNNFLFRVLRALRAIDTRWGLNYKRGNAPTLSEDILAYNGTARSDNGESHVWLVDIVGGACFSGVGGLAEWMNYTITGTWSQRGQSYCGTEWCARWTIDPYLAAGLPAFP